MKSLALRAADILASPFVFSSGLLLKQVRRGWMRLPASRAALRSVGVLPVRDHYYEPQIRFPADIDWGKDRALPGIDWNEAGQLKFLDQLVPYGPELKGLPRTSDNPLDFYLDNNQFAAGDGEIWYCLVRALKPRRIFEIGSGNSTKAARLAIKRNTNEDASYRCRHVCIEPYEMPWLEQTGVEVIRRKAEDMPVSFFSELDAGDVLFIDSSHIIRPHGDVLFEYLELLPQLKAGVIVHVHDIFSPRNYPREWIVDDIRLWNEQYLLEAFLSHNASWEIIAACNYLHAKHFDRYHKAAPNITRELWPGSFYMRRR